MIHFPKLFLDPLPGAVLTTESLKSMGITPQLAHHYMKQKWLVSLGNGAYLRQNDYPSWVSALSTLQISGVKVYGGGGQSLDLLGFNQNIPLGKPFVHLFTPPTIRLPKWFLNYDFGATFHVTRTHKYGENNLMDHLVHHKSNGFMLRISRPEQAILDVCRYVPKIYSFENLRNYMESLISLNPTVMQTLLENAESIKEKRLFLYMASTVNHSWYKKLNLEKIDLGKGPRQIVRDGVYNSEFKILIPQ
jgi:hypothetical protein